MASSLAVKAARQAATAARLSSSLVPHRGLAGAADHHGPPKVNCWKDPMSPSQWKEEHEAICSSLEDYNKQIEQLKQEMNDATHGADNIRNDISALAQRYAVIDRDEDCGVCQKKILTAGWDHRMARGYTLVGAMAPFYVFPCGHAFHAQCLVAHVTRCTNRAQTEYILDMQKQLTLLGGESRKESSGALTEEDLITSMTPTDKIRSQLDDAIASECPFCGDLMIREISLPFVLPEEEHEAASWEIKPHNIGSQ
ncbi:vacuolar sorting protein 18-like isoform X2 [Actinidia eriantha]|uniref:vacuolar sorting protein 18-like isoform X2 n=1 Tax=Actinidia eriantha TaxID=165200 RepID=UPI002590AB03|nr:vacuolar sorting protein 18-like isoform X2 [Actinidia eriantha]